MRLGICLKAPKGVKIENIEFLRIYSILLVQNPYTSRTNTFTYETMVILGSHMHIVGLILEGLKWNFFIFLFSLL